MDTSCETVLKIYADCCYSGKWAKQCKRHTEQTDLIKNGKEPTRPEWLLKRKGKRVGVQIYAACAHDEVATENVFTDLLKGQLPDTYGFKKLKDLKGTMIGEEQTLTYGFTRVFEKHSPGYDPEKDMYEKETQTMKEE